MYLHFIIVINLFLIDYACCKLCNILLLLFENNSRSSHYTGASHWRKNIVGVITQDRVIGDNLKRQTENRTFYTLDYSYSPEFFNISTICQSPYSSIYIE